MFTRYQVKTKNLGKCFRLSRRLLPNYAIAQTCTIIDIASLNAMYIYGMNEAHHPNGFISILILAKFRVIHSAAGLPSFLGSLTPVSVPKFTLPREPLPFFKPRSTELSNVCVISWQIALIPSAFS